MDDWQLIESYARQKSEPAFRVLVERYAGLVHASALRQVRDPQLAQDVAQAVFILFARKAGELRRGTVLSGWLFQTTRFVAARAVRSEQRRQRREQEAFDMQQLTSNDEAWRRMTPVIDEALNQLSRPDRDAILGRFFEGRSLREVGDLLGITEEAAKKRVTRAVEKLKETIGRNGVALSVTAMAAALISHANAGAPAAFVSTLAANSLAATGASATAAELVSEVVAGWRWAKLKWAGLAMVAVLLCVTPLVLRHTAKTGEQVRTKRTDEGRAALANPPTNALVGAAGDRTAALSANEHAFLLHVVAADDGTPVTNARVAFNYVLTHEFWTNRFDLRTDQSGTCVISFPTDTARIDVGVVTDGWAARYATWPSDGLPGIAIEHTLRLERVTNFVGGVILDSQSRPLADAQIRFQSFDAGDSSQRERQRERFGFLTPLSVVRTDSQGRWNIGFIPSRNGGFALHATHAEFPDTPIISILPEKYDTSPDLEKGKRLWNRELVTTMNAAFALEGTVVDEQGAAIAAAKIQHDSYQSEVFEADSAGKFRVPRLAAGKWEFTASAEGHAPVRTNIDVGARMEPMVITLQTGAVLRVRVVDEFDAEVMGATVAMEQWAENRQDIEWKVKTDRFGRVEWLSAPRAVPIELCAWGDGYCFTRDVRVQADGAEHLIRLRHSLDVYGRVVDAANGRGLRDLKAVPGYGSSDRFSNSEDRWETGSTVRGTNGQFKITFNESTWPWLLRVTVDGYEDWISPPLTNFQSVVLDIAMKRSGFAGGFHGVVERPDGTPAIGATVGLLAFENNFTLRKKLLDGNKRWLRTAGQRGEFAFDVNRLAHSVVAVGEAGFVLVRVADPREAVILRLQPWGRVEGDVDVSARQDAVEELRLYDPVTMNYQGQVSLLNSYVVKPDAQMHFVFENVPAGEYVVGINSGIGIPFHHLTATQVAPGETARVTIRDGAGARVRGRVQPRAGERLLNQEVHIWLNPATAMLPYQRLQGEEQQRAALEFWTAPAGRDYWKRQQSFWAHPAADGSFAFRDRIPPGQYKFAATSKGGSVSTNIVVSEENPRDIDLGELRLR